MAIKSGDIRGFEGYSQFVSLEEFNHHLEMWMLEYKKDFSKGERVGLKRLVRFAAKIPGVSNAKIGTVLKTIHEEYHDMGISRSTFKRMILKAIKLGIFTVHETQRKNGSQSSNLYVFNRYPTNGLPSKGNTDQHNKAIDLYKTNINKINKREETPAVQEPAEKAPKDHLFVSDRIPKPFVELVHYFFPTAKAIEEFWRMTTMTAYRHNLESEKETILDISLTSFRQLIRKLKSKTTVKNPIAYFTGILNKKFQEIYFAELFKMGFCS